MIRADDNHEDEELGRGPEDPGAPVDRVNLGSSVRAMRKQVGITQEALADRLGVHTTFIGRMERGERGAQWRTIRRVLRALDLRPSDFAATLEEIEHEQAMGGAAWRS